MQRLGGRVALLEHVYIRMLQAPRLYMSVEAVGLEIEKAEARVAEVRLRERLRVRVLRVRVLCCASWCWTV